MFRKSLLTLAFTFFMTPLCFAMEKKYPHEQHTNNNCPIIMLPKKIFSHMLIEHANPVQSLESTMKNFIKLSITCRALKQLLTHEIISSFCQHYTQDTKDKSLEKLIGKTSCDNHKIMHIPLLLSIYTGANPNINPDMPLLRRAVDNNDIALVTTLFQYKANPNAQYSIKKNPIFFLIRTKEMAQTFINNKDFDIQAEGSEFYPNVLWQLKDYDANLLELYLQHQVDPLLLRQNKSCLLHKLADCSFDKNLLKKGKLLLNAMPGMINAVNDEGKTPLDKTYKALKHRKWCKDEQERLEELIALFKDHGGKTGKELDIEPPRKIRSKPNSIRIGGMLIGYEKNTAVGY